MPFRGDTEEAIRSNIGRLLVWIGQSEDPGQLENKKTLRYKGAVNGVCHAVVHDWLGRELPYLGHGFADYFRFGIPDDIRAIQCALTGKIDETKAMLLREGQSTREMTVHSQSLSQVAQTVTLELRGLRIADLQERLATFKDKLLKVFESDGMKLLIRDKTFASLDEIWEQVQAAGYYQIHVEGDGEGSGHALGLKVGSPEVQLLDPNSGLAEFCNFYFMKKFFEPFWTKYYSGKFTRFSVASYVAQEGVDYSKYPWLTGAK